MTQPDLPEDPIRDALLAIRAANDGILTPAMIVEAARDPDHVLHSHFQWDDEKAAEAWRRTQARRLVRVVRQQYIDKRGEPQQIRVFHSVPNRAVGRSYVPLDELEANQEMSREVARQMDIDWRNFKRRYSQYTDFMARIDRYREQAGEEAGPDGPEHLDLGDEGQGEG
jgi:hypothetical protein